MIDIVNRLRFDATRCEATFSKGVAENITEGVDEIERLREALVMADNRLECALLDEVVCRHCVELARSYLTQQKQDR